MGKVNPEPFNFDSCGLDWLLIRLSSFVCCDRGEEWDWRGRERGGWEYERCERERYGTSECDHSPCIGSN